MRRVAFVGPALQRSLSQVPVALAVHQRRQISWNAMLNPTKWFDNDEIHGNVRVTSAKVEEELPEIFTQQPQEVDDYIRPEKSWFEKLEDVWEFVASFFHPVDKQVEILRSLHHDGLMGFDLGGWGGVFVFYGFALRLATLLPSLYSHRNALRMSHISPQLTEIQQNQQKMKNDKTLTASEKRVVKEGLARIKLQVCRKHGCAQWKSFMQGITAPVTLSAFMAIRRLAVYETDLESATFLWVKDLTLPDPSNALPVVCAAMFLVNFEMNQRMQRGGRSASGMYIRWAVRGGSVVALYFFTAQPSALFAYWIGMSAAGFIQPMLLRNRAFRSMFNFPDPPHLAKEAILKAEIKGPTIMERLFDSKEKAAEKQKARDEKLAKAKASAAFQKIEDFDVVFEDNNGKVKR